MSDLIAVVQSTKFELDTKGRLRPGDLYPVAEYSNLEGRFAGPIRRLILVTPASAEKVWLVAILERPQLHAVTYRAGMNRTPILDITSLRAKLPLDDAFLFGSPQAPRVLTPPQTLLMPGASEVQSLEDFAAETEKRATDEHRREYAATIRSVSELIRRAGVAMPPLLQTLFDQAAERQYFEWLSELGIELGSGRDMIDDDALQTGLPFVPFAADGFGDVYGLSFPSPGTTPCVVRYRHEDGSLEFGGHDVADWLARILASEEELAADEGRELDSATQVRARLPPLERNDLRMPGWLDGRGVEEPDA